MKFLKALDKVLSAIEEHALSLSIIVMMIVLVANFLARYLFQSGVAWTEEVGKLCMVVVTYLGLSYVTKMCRHINMSILTDRLPDKVRHFWQIVLNAICGLFFTYLCYSGLRYAMIVKATGRVTTTLRLPVHIWLVLMAVGFFFTAIRFFQISILNIVHPDETYYTTEYPGPVLEEDAALTPEEEAALLAEAEAFLHSNANKN